MAFLALVSMRKMQQVLSCRMCFCTHKNLLPTPKSRDGRVKTAQLVFMENPEQPPETPRKKGSPKGGHPKLPEAKKRGQRLFLRLTPAEKAVLEKKAQKAGVQLSHYCRSRLLDTAPLYWVNPLELMAAFREASQEMHPVGVTITQMAKHIHTNPGKVSSETLDRFNDLVSAFMIQQQAVATSFQKFVAGKK
jgi:hypothetical protein